MVGGDRLGERFQLGEAAYPFGRRVAGAVACHEVDSFGLGEGGKQSAGGRYHDGAGWRDEGRRNVGVVY